MALRAGTKLGPYEVVAPIGAGGMGEVYRARDTRLDRTVAIKILPSQFSTDPVRKQRFEREAKTISQLNHPHICTLHDVGSQDSIEYLVMECLEGETLAKRLEKGALPLQQALRCGAQIADALDKAHRVGIVHRDLKPGNIMLTAGGAKLLDFGLAKPAVAAMVATMTVAQIDAAVTEEGTVVGTIQYMSPEQLQGRDVDGRSDIFSLGAVLYEAVTGRKAFEGKSQLSVASAILEKEPPPITASEPTSPLGLDHVLQKCLAKDPNERWQTASDVKSELNWIVESGSRATVPGPIVGLRKRKMAPAWAIAATALAVFALLVGYFRLANRRPPLLISSVLPPPGAQIIDWPKVSPDGRTLLLVAVDAQGRSMLWLRPLDSPSAQPVTGTEDADRPFWSPDGHSVGFFADGKLKTVRASGGPVLTLADAPFPLGGTWNEKGMILFVPHSGSGIYEVSASGGTPSLLWRLDKSKFSNVDDPNFLPDGRHFTYTGDSLQSAYSGIYLASVDGRENKLLVHANTNTSFSSGYLFFAQPTGSGADLMALAIDPTNGAVKSEPEVVAHGLDYLEGPNASPFAVSDGTLIYEANPGAAVAPRTMWLDRSGKTISEVPVALNVSDLRLSPDGQRVAYSKGDPNSDIWVQELKRDAPMRLTFDTSVDKGAPVWSPDGMQLLFDVALDGKTPPGIYRTAASGTGNLEMVAQPKDREAMLWPTDWSRDGRFVLCVQGDIITRSKGEIWIVPVSGDDRKPRVFIRAPAAAYDGHFSPDGRWVAYVSKESGREEVYVVPFDANQILNTPPFRQVAITNRWPVSSNGGAFPRWRRDGKELFYVAPGNQFVAVAVESKGNSFSLSQARLLFREPLTIAAFPYDVTPDGERFLVNTFEQNERMPLTLVVNWKELLKNK